MGEEERVRRDVRWLQAAGIPVGVAFHAHRAGAVGDWNFVMGYHVRHTLFRPLLVLSPVLLSASHVASPSPALHVALFWQAASVRLLGYFFFSAQSKYGVSVVTQTIERSCVNEQQSSLCPPCNLTALILPELDRRAPLACCCPCLICFTAIAELGISLVKAPVNVMRWFTRQIPC